MSASSTSEEVAAATREVLENSNLDEINERKLRQLVKERTGADTSLPDLKALIHSVVQEFLGEHDKEEDEKGDVEAPSEPKATKPKKRKVDEHDDEEDDEDEPEQKHSKKSSKQQAAKKFPVADNGDLIVCKLSAKRRVSVNEHKGTIFVSIREFYEKGGQELPGKGVSLPVEQWETLSKHVDDVNAAIQQAQRK